MTQEEQDATLGRTRREYREAKNKLGALKKRNSEIAASARALASAIEQHPDRILVPKGQVAASGTIARALEMANIEYTYYAEDAGRLNSETLRAHLEEFVTVQHRKASLRQQLIEQGDDDPDQ